MMYGCHVTACMYCGGPNVHGDCIDLDSPCPQCNERIEERKTTDDYVCLRCDWSGSNPPVQLYRKACPCCNAIVARNMSLYRATELRKAKATQEVLGDA